MEIWYLIGIAYLYGRMLLLGLIVLVGASLSLKKSSRWLGAALSLPAGLYGGWILLTPERLALTPQPPLVSTRLFESSKPLPPSLIIHGYHGHAPGEATLKREALDALALAETGLFRVFLSGMGENDPILGEAVLKSSIDCAKTRSLLQDFSQNGSRIGSLSFTARTGFARCAELTVSPVALPPDRLDLWTSAPSGDPGRGEFGDLVGEMTLRATEGGTQRLISTRQARARHVPDALSRLGAYGHDPRPEHSEIGVYAAYDPDPVGFVLDGLHIDPASLPRQGALSDDELAARANDIVASVPDAVGKLRVAISLIGATRGGQDAVIGVEGRLAPTLLGGPPNPRLIVRTSSDCPVAMRAAAGRAALAPACTGAFASKAVSCRVPLDREEFLERCVAGFRDAIWEEIKGRPILVVGSYGGSSGLGIGKVDRGESAILKRVVVQPAGGPLDLVLVSSSSTVWSFEGSLGCLERVTLVGDGQGVVGVKPDLIQFRNRQGADHVEDGRPGRQLSGLLGRTAAEIIPLKPNASSVVVGERGWASTACRSTALSPPPQAPPSPDQVVSRPDEVAFALP